MFDRKANRPRWTVPISAGLSLCSSLLRCSTSAAACDGGQPAAMHTSNATQAQPCSPPSPRSRARSLRISTGPSIAFATAALLLAVLPVTLRAVAAEPLAEGDREYRVLADAAAFENPDGHAVPPFTGDNANVRGPAPPHLQALLRESLQLDERYQSAADAGATRALLHGARKPKDYSKCKRCTYVRCNANRALCSGHCKANRILYMCDNRVVGPPVGVPQPVNAPDEPAEMNYGNIKPLQVIPDGPFVGCAVNVFGSDPCRVPEGRYAAVNGSRPLLEDSSGTASGGEQRVDAECFSDGAAVVPRFLGVEVGSLNRGGDDDAEDSVQNDYEFEVGVCVCKYETAGSGSVVQDLCIDADSALLAGGADSAVDAGDDDINQQSDGSELADNGLYPSQEIQFGDRTIRLDISADAKQDDDLEYDGLVGDAEGCIGQDYGEDYASAPADLSDELPRAPGFGLPCVAPTPTSPGRARRRLLGSRRQQA